MYPGNAFGRIMTRNDLEGALRAIEEQSRGWSYVAEVDLAPPVDCARLARLLDENGNPSLPADYLEFVLIANGFAVNLFRKSAQNARSNPAFIFQVFGLPAIVASTRKFRKQEDDFIAVAAGPNNYRISENDRLVYESSLVISDFEDTVLIHPSAPDGKTSEVYRVDNNYLFEEHGWLTRVAGSLEEYLSRSFSTIVEEKGATWGFY